MKTLQEYVNEAKEDKKVYWHYDEKQSYESLSKDSKFLEECGDCFVVLHIYEIKHAIGRIKDYYYAQPTVKVIFNKYFQPWVKKSDANAAIRETWPHSKSWKTGYGAAACKHKLVVAAVADAFGLKTLEEICKKEKVGGFSSSLSNSYVQIKTLRDDNL